MALRPTFLIPAIILGGAFASRLAMNAVPAAFRVDLEAPIPVVTTWGNAGILPVAILLTTIALATIVYLTCLRAQPPSHRETLICAALSLACGFFWLPLFSSDTYAYAAYGEFARLRINPYAHLSVPPANALLDAALWQWRPAIPPCVYGPGFVLFAQAILIATHALPIALILDAFRVLSCLCLLGCAMLLERRAAFFVCCNPVVLWSAIEGHNDTIMLLVVLTGIMLSHRYARTGAAIATLGALIKAPAIGAGAALAIQAFLDRRSLSPFSGFLIGCVVLAVAVVPLLQGIGRGVATHGAYAPSVSVQALGWPIAAFVAIFVLFQLRTATTWIDRFCIIALAFWLAIPNPYPWYSLWILPLAAFATDRRLAACALAISCAAMLRYLPDAVAAPSGLATIALGLCAALAYLPLLSRAIISRS